MSDSVLKKQFSEQDIQRVRNLVRGKNGDRITQGVGLMKSSIEDHVEGDIWEENGRKWTIKNGIKENITKLDKFKKVSVPTFCPTCKNVMDKQLDPHYYKSHGSCLDCITKLETKLKLEGKWEEHANNIRNQEIDKTIEEYKSFMEATLDESNNSFVTEAGDVQKWLGGVDKERALKTMEDGINYLNSLKK